MTKVIKVVIAADQGKANPALATELIKKQLGI
jgi:hypothetical protein